LPISSTPPELGTPRPAMGASSVLLPDPDVPVIATASPFSTVRLAMLKMFNTPELSATRWQRSVTTILGVDCMRWGKSVAVWMGMVMMLSMRVGLAAPDTPAATPADTNAAPVRILVFGDSLSAEYGLPRGSGWVSHIEERL